MQKIFKIALLFSILSVVFLFSEKSKAENEQKTFGIGDIIFFCNVSEGKYLRARSAPNLDAMELASIHRGDIVLAQDDDVSKGWLRITLDWGADAYVWYEHLSTTPPGERDGWISANGRVRLRDAPNGSFVRWVDPGVPVVVTGTKACSESIWANVRIGSAKGWVMDELIAYDGQCSTSFE